MDASQQRFLLPEEKRHDIAQLAFEVLQSTHVSSRQLAQLAGKIAASPAVPLGPLLARAVYKAMTGQDIVYPSTQALADIQCYLECLTVAAGGRRWKRSRTLLVAGDAAEYAYAAYTPNHEFPHPMVITFTEQELQLVAQNQYSSTLREIVCILWVVKIILQTDPARVQHIRLQYETDSQAGLQSIMGMKGNASTSPVVKELRLLCALHDVELDVVWSPRSDLHQQIADAYSKVQDGSDWSLHPAMYAQLLLKPVLQGRVPALDVFASSANSNAEGAFYSKYLWVPRVQRSRHHATPWGSLWHRWQQAASVHQWPIPLPGIS